MKRLSLEKIVQNWFMVVHEAVEKFDKLEIEKLYSFENGAREELIDFGTMINLLENLEWEGMRFESDGSTYHCCPHCGARENTKHQEFCVLNNLLEKYLIPGE
jgi:hypothetical protein